MGENDRFDDVYDDKFELDEPEIGEHGVEPADSHALDEMVEGVDKEDVDIEGLLEVGLNYIDINRFEQAIETFERGLRFAEDNQELWINKGVAHSEMEEFQEAIGAYREALNINPKSTEAAQAYVNLAFAKHELGQAEDVLQDLNNAIDIENRLPEAWYNKAFFLNERGRHEDALRAAENAISLGFRNAVTLEEKARALEGMEEYEEAESVREEVRETQEEDVREAMRE
ncbi:MAG: tetratricopeptide repeat protein [Halobacteria archaeon]